VDGNQINIEERFFASSRPETAAYADVNIYQAASDHHRVVEAFSALYTGCPPARARAAWPRSTIGVSSRKTSTAASRTSPPNDVNNAEDRYDEFFENVGSEVLNYVGSVGLLWACDFVRAGQDFTYEYQAATELGWPDRDYPHHSRASVATLNDAEQLEAANTVRRWAGLPPLGGDRRVATSSSQRPVLEALFASELDELRGALRQGHRL